MNHLIYHVQNTPTAATATPSNSHLSVGGAPTSTLTSASAAAAAAAVLTPSQIDALLVTYRTKAPLTAQEFLDHAVLPPKSVALSRMEALHNASRGVELIDEDDAVCDTHICSIK